LLLDIAPKSEDAANINEHAKKLRDEIAGKPHTMQLTIPSPVYGGDEGQIDITLIKNEVEIMDVEKGIDTLDVYCKKGIRRLNYPEGDAWIIPKSWQPCALSVNGKVGASLTLTELPAGSLKKKMP
jgi:hypothetical protein